MQMPQVRKPEFAFDFPKYWFGGSRLATHLGNGMNFVFPAGERFFIRSVRYYLPQIQDPVLQARVDAFVGQEAQHQRAHLQAFLALEKQGFDVQGYLVWYERVAYEGIEPRTSPALRLSTTAALEHFTATFAELALGTELLDAAAPELQRLLKWHAAEEIEHRDVAFDVLQLVNPSWGLRVAGFVVAFSTLGFFWAAGTRHLLRQDPWVADTEGKARIRGFWTKNGPYFARQLFRYLKPGFHPNDAQTDGLARDYIRATLTPA